MSATEMPQPTLQGLTFLPIPEFSDPECAFGAKQEAYFDRYDLPKVPRAYEDFVSGMFFRGGKLPEMARGIDRVKASRAIKAWLCSFAPAHEAKVTTVAYALWVWGAKVPGAEGN